MAIIVDPSDARAGCRSTMLVDLVYPPDEPRTE